MQPGAHWECNAYGHVYRLTGQPELAKPYFEMARELLEQQVADPNLPVCEIPQLMQLALVTAGAGDLRRRQALC